MSSYEFSFVDATGKEYIGRLRGGGQAFQIDPTGADVPFSAVYLSPRVGNPAEDAARLGNLRKRKGGSLVAEALSSVEPRVQSVEENSATGRPMIWADIGMPELVPLPLLGEGMTRVKFCSVQG